MDRTPLKNDAGVIIDGIRKLKRCEFGTGKTYVNNDPIVDWKNNKTEFADKDGFDIRNIEANGNYFIEMDLPYDTRLIRYGPESGVYTAPYGTDYDDLSLPYVRESVEYHEYKVIANSLKVVCHVHKGIVAPMFDSRGGAVQYLHPDSNILELVKSNVLERI